jgi:signal transduction histidine kinase
MLGLFGVGILALSLEATAQGRGVLTPEQDEYLMWTRLELVEDPSGAWKLEDVRALDASRWQAVEDDDVPSFGYTESAWWARFQVVNRVPEAVWVLEVANKSLDYVTLFTPTDSGYAAQQVGDALPFNRRPVRHRNAVFNVSMPSSEVHTYYLRVASRGPVSLPVRIWSAEAFLQKDQQVQFFLGVFFGILAIMVIYNLTLYVVFRDRSYLYYVLYIATYILYQLSVERIAFEYFWPEQLWWAARSNTVLALFSAVWGMQFSRTYLHASDYTPRLDTAIVGLMALCPVLAALALLGMPGINALVVVFMIVMVIVVMATGVRCLAKGNRAARYYVLAWSFLLIGILVAMLRYLDLLPYTFLTARSIQIGAALEVTLLSLGLGYRYNLLRRQRERMRLRIASDLHDDIGSGLTQISLQSELVRRHVDGQPATWATSIGATARELAETMRDIVWAIKPEQETWEALEFRLRDFARTLDAASDIAVNVEGRTEGAPPGTLPPGVRQNVLLMTKEMLNNAVRHADASTVHVRWHLTRDHLRLHVADNGRGFDPAAVKRGHGLGNLHRRAEEINAHLTLHTAPGQPTTYEVDVPLSRHPT